MEVRAARVLAKVAESVLDLALAGSAGPGAGAGRSALPLVASRLQEPGDPVRLGSARNLYAKTW